MPDDGHGLRYEHRLKHVGIISSVLGLATAGSWLDGGLSGFPEGSGQADGPAGRPCQQHGRGKVRVRWPKKKKTLKRLKKSIRKGWLECLAGSERQKEVCYLTAEVTTHREHRSLKPHPRGLSRGCRKSLQPRNGPPLCAGAGTGTASHAGRAGPGKVETIKAHPPSAPKRTRKVCPRPAALRCFCPPP